MTMLKDSIGDHLAFAKKRGQKRSEKGSGEGEVRLKCIYVPIE